jgi:hypothetical protein
MPDLLPDDFGTETLQPPLAILREQAEHLARRTGGLVLATVGTSRKGIDFIHRFRLEVPALDDYVYSLFTVNHKVLLYPVDLRSDLLVDEYYSDLKNSEEFESALRTFFGLDQVRKVIVALIAQATAVQT